MNHADINNLLATETPGFDHWQDFHLRSVVCRDLVEPLQNLFIAASQVSGPLSDEVEALRIACARVWREEQ